MTEQTMQVREPCLGIENSTATCLTSLWSGRLVCQLLVNRQHHDS
jgi:hypothetical protein